MLALNRPRVQLANEHCASLKRVILDEAVGSVQYRDTVSDAVQELDALFA